METIPKDPAMLMSFLNLKLRDYYESLDRLCEELNLDREEICGRLAAADYAYDPVTNRFV